MKFIKYAVLSSIVLLVLTTSSGCMSARRGEPLPESLGDEAQIAGIPYARFWGDEPLPYEHQWLTASEEKLASYFSGIMHKEHTYLALSGGGADGAFGAGLLAGWTAAGTRPEFTIVTGISTGSLIAPFAFPPVFFEVEANGQIYDELHVDGGVANQVFLYPIDMNWAGIMDTLKIKGTPNVYVIRNSSWRPDWQSVEPELIPIAGRSVGSLIRTQGIGDVYREDRLVCNSK